MDTITVGEKECGDCKYYQLIEESKKDVYIYCAARDKRYYYGTRISCDDKEKAYSTTHRLKPMGL